MTCVGLHEMFIARKQTLFASDHRLIGEITVAEHPDGAHRVLAVVWDPEVEAPGGYPPP